MWAFIVRLLGGNIVSRVVDAFVKSKDVELEKYKVDGTISVAALQTMVEHEKTKATILVAEQGHWLTRSIRPLMAVPVVIYLWKVVAFDKVIGPLLGWKLRTDPIDGNVAIWVGIIIGGYFTVTGALDVLRFLRK